VTNGGALYGHIKENISLLSPGQRFNPQAVAIRTNSNNYLLCVGYVTTLCQQKRYFLFIFIVFKDAFSIV